MYVKEVYYGNAERLAGCQPNIMEAIKKALQKFFDQNGRDLGPNFGPILKAKAEYEIFDTGKPEPDDVGFYHQDDPHGLFLEIGVTEIVCKDKDGKIIFYLSYESVFLPAETFELGLSEKAVNMARSTANWLYEKSLDGTPLLYSATAYFYLRDFDEGVAIPVDENGVIATLPLDEAGR